jgi:hypothetical protein
MLMWFSFSQRYGVHDLCSLVLEDAGDNYLGMTPGVESTLKNIQSCCNKMQHKAGLASLTRCFFASPDSASPG